MRRIPWRKVGRVILAGMLTVSLLAVAAVLWLSHDLPGEGEILTYQAPRTTRLYARDGRLIATLYEENRQPVALDQVSDAMRNAIVAIEDSRFYRHPGVDLRSVFRALAANAAAGSLEQGGSTITMQLARNSYLSNERTLSRKIREAILALKLERLYEKPKILELYLNQVYFGAGAYGVDAAANLYFATTPAELTTAQAAMLAGLVQAPSHLNPFTHPERAKKRQKQVLQRMRELRLINDEELEEAEREAGSTSYAAPPSYQVGEGMLKSPYFTTYAIRQASLVVSEPDLYRRGLEIYTTVDIDLQREAERILGDALASAGPGYNAGSGALVLIENESGAIRAMVGGRGWSVDDQFNRAWQASRQPGSAFKPFLYTAALEMGYHPTSIVLDRPVELSGWRPQNHDNRFLGALSLADSLRLSRNVVAVRLIEQLGSERVASLARRMGLAGELPPYPSLALGAAEATPLEMARAYATFPRGGETAPVHAIKSVRYPEGETISPKDLSTTRVMTEMTARQMVMMMKQVVETGTGRAARLAGYDVAGKTGTTDAYRDAWFVGFTPRYTLAVWIGNDDRTPTWGVSGGGLPAQIFAQVMAAAERGRPPLAFDLPDYTGRYTPIPAPPAGSTADDHTSSNPIRVYRYSRGGEEVTVLTNRSDYSYEPPGEYEFYGQ